MTGEARGGQQLQIMNMIADAVAPWLRGGSPKAVLHALNRYARGAEGWCWPSLETLGKAAGLSDRAVSPIIDKLEEHGVIEIVRGRSYHTPNRYRIRPEALSALRPEATSHQSTEVASPHPKGEVRSLCKTGPKFTSNRSEATSEEGVYEGDYRKESISVADATDGPPVEVKEQAGRTDHQRVIAHYADVYRRTGDQKTEPVTTKEDGAWIKRLLAGRGFAGTCKVIDDHFSDKWRAERIRSLNKIDPNVMAASTPSSPSPRSIAKTQPVQPAGGGWMMAENDNDAEQETGTLNS